MLLPIRKAWAQETFPKILQRYAFSIPDTSSTLHFLVDTSLIFFHSNIFVNDRAIATLSARLNHI